jgi:hydrogenase maturation protease
MDGAEARGYIQDARTRRYTMPDAPVQESGVRPAVLVLGIGNIILGDEGVGVHVVEQMRNTPLPDDVELVDGGTSGAGLVDEIAGRRKLIVVDAMKADVAPGTVYRLGMDDLLREADRLSLHEFGLTDTLMMAKHLGCAPEEVVIFGVQPKEIRVGLDLSPEVASIVPDLISVVAFEAVRTHSPQICEECGLDDESFEVTAP